MKGTRSRLALAALCAAALLAGGASLGGCASGEPWTPPANQARSSLPRAPVVAPSGPTSPWWWPLFNSWYPANW